MLGKTNLYRRSSNRRHLIQKYQGQPLRRELSGENQSYREDGTPKANGFLGVYKRPDGMISSEISVGVNINGKEMDIPTMVPGLSDKELNYLLTTPMDAIPTADKAVFSGIQQKAIDHAKARIRAGLSPFAGEGEQIQIAKQKIDNLQTIAANNKTTPEQVQKIHSI